MKVALQVDILHAAAARLARAKYAPRVGHKLATAVELLWGLPCSKQEIAAHPLKRPAAGVLQPHGAKDRFEFAFIRACHCAWRRESAQEGFDGVLNRFRPRRPGASEAANEVLPGIGVLFLYETEGAVGDGSEGHPTLAVFHPVLRDALLRGHRPPLPHRHLLPEMVGGG
eukprot:CAMPEP_0177792536 /NCGR_PEP_ID=MMETSP0491_2-20121128/24579_1 /TAXON_ID=63592 /ORGANISM="Tetraselmis chuii, Strain PLY429" /LENGTH=169 /DNA_ID=CAMNT_0019314961 /DNA_START=246 /DNA_END=755 /DNA_ORIENTATION=-